MWHYVLGAAVGVAGTLAWQRWRRRTGKPQWRHRPRITHTFFGGNN